MKKNIIVIILTILVLGMAGYIVYDKVLSTKEENNNYQENNNNNQNQDNNNKGQEDNIYEMKTTKTYAGCSKEAYQSNQVSFEYATYVLEIKEEDKCVLRYGGFYSNINGFILPTFDCVVQDSYVIIINNNIPLYFKINNDDTITYQNGNIVMKKVDSPENVDYNFCKNNY